MLTRPVILLSAVSLLTDISSEMLYPVMPIYLKAAGFTFVLIGILEGVAEGIAGLLKGVSGQLSDRLNNRTLFVRTGYGLSSVSKPMLALFAHPLWIFLARAIDRTGKGLRSAPRDALLAHYSLPEHRARVFGFHRAMDTTGAVLGPLAALAILSQIPGAYRELFLIAFIPAALGALLTLFVRDADRPQSPGMSKESMNPLRFLGYLKTGSPKYRRLAAGLLAFALINSSDVFLILMMKERGLSDTHAILAYVFYNIVFAAAAFPAGAIADRIGLRKVFAAGLVIFAFVYGGFSMTGLTMNAFFVLLACYGIYAALTEGISKAWITKLVPREEAGTAVGAVISLQSLSAVAASTAAGAVWQIFGPEVLFAATAVLAFTCAVYFLTAVSE